jgi:hypothetical protein
MQATIESIAETAAFLRRRSKNLSFKDAVAAALDQHGEGNPVDREIIFKQVCSILGKRGNRKRATMRAQGIKRERQGTFRFSQSKGS